MSGGIHPYGYTQKDRQQQAADGKNHGMGQRSADQSGDGHASDGIHSQTAMQNIPQEMADLHINRLVQIHGCAHLLRSGLGWRAGRGS